MDGKRRNELSLEGCKKELMKTFLSVKDALVSFSYAVQISTQEKSLNLSSFSK